MNLIPLPARVKANYVFMADGTALEVYSWTCNAEQTVFNVAGCRGNHRWVLKDGVWARCP